jgi:hypothetical protein
VLWLPERLRLLDRLRRGAVAADRAGGGLWLDLALYGLSAVFAFVTAITSTLMPHRAWGTVAIFGYALATVFCLIQLAVPRLAGAGVRLTVAAVTWVTAALLPLMIQTAQRSSGRLDRAQEEVLVIEDGGRRLLETGTPYLGRAAIAALPESDRLLGYLPYQPGMALFGLPRAADTGAHWWSDARVWFAVVTAVALVTAVLVLRRLVRPEALVRAVQVATVLPLCALTLATGGDDLPVLALCLLALALAGARRPGWAGVAVGVAAALKLFAWPVLLVLAVWAVAGGGRVALSRFAVGAVGIPVVTLLPALFIDRDALVENVLRYPFGRGLVTSPAASPLPGHLIATSLSGGRTIATALLLASGAALAVWLVRRPPRSAAAAAAVIAVGLLLAMLLLPATRFGYLLYPVAFGVWAACLTTIHFHYRPDGRRVENLPSL